MKKKEKNIMCNLWISYFVQVVWGLVKDPVVHENVMAEVVGHHKIMSLSMLLWSLTLSFPHAWIRRLMSYCGNLWNPPLSPTTLTMAKVPLALMVPPQALRVRQQQSSENIRQIPWLWCLVLWNLLYFHWDVS